VGAEAIALNGTDQGPLDISRQRRDVLNLAGYGETGICGGSEGQVLRRHEGNMDGVRVIDHDLGIELRGNIEVVRKAYVQIASSQLKN